MYEIEVANQLNELKGQIEKIQRTLLSIERIKETSERTDIKTDNIIKCNERHKKQILKHIKLKVDTFMNTYEDGSRRTLFGKIQGSIFSNFVVNAYEDLPYVVLPNVIQHIQNWIPDDETEAKLEKWKIPYEQIDLFEGDI